MTKQPREWSEERIIAEVDDHLGEATNDEREQARRLLRRVRDDYQQRIAELEQVVHGYEYAIEYDREHMDQIEAENKRLRAEEIAWNRAIDAQDEYIKLLEAELEAAKDENERLRGCDRLASQE